MTADTTLLTYRVYYPGGRSPRIIYARDAEEAAMRAQQRWGTPPASVDLYSTSETREEVTR